MKQFKQRYIQALQESVEIGQLGLQDYLILTEAHKNPYRITKSGRQVNLMYEIEKHARKHLVGDALTFWTKLVTWFKANWATILKLLLSLLLL